MSKPKVRKLLRVLVAGGVALAGVAATRAQEKGAPATENADKGKEKDQEAAKAKAEKERKEQEKKAQEKKGDEAKKAAESDGGGVKGW